MEWEIKGTLRHKIIHMRYFIFSRTTVIQNYFFSPLVAFQVFITDLQLGH